MTLPKILSNFVTDLHDSLEDIQKFEQAILGEHVLTTSDLGTQPESWTEDVLINPILEIVELNKAPGRPSTGILTPDFKLLVSDELTIVGESKSINKIEEAVKDIKSDYISRKSWPDYGIATDGIEWVIFRAESSGDFYEYHELARINFRETIQKIAKEKGLIEDGKAEESIEATKYFLNLFEIDNLTRLLKKEAPQKIREEQKRDTEKFFDIYAKLIFGRETSSSRYLIRDIIAPESASSKEIDVFAVTLVNRLLFIKMLESRGILEEGFIEERLDEYNNDLPVSLYSAVIKPLFYKSFNTPEQERKDDLQAGWPNDVPFLNGGLFRPNIQNETEYDVRNNTLKFVIEKLIIGYQLEVDVNPKLLGNVFEKTINYISEEENRQLNMGAFYTPDDVTQLIIGQTVDQKAKEILIDAFTEKGRHPEEFQAKNEDRQLQDILQDIEFGEAGWGNIGGAEQALTDLKQLRILDMACGSGHFLTAALGELHQVLMSLLRGIHGEEPSGKSAYEEKKSLALNCIYGVDIDPVAIEIAKLRVWLAIVSDGWKEDYGRLPNIDFNVITGNSLIGLPIQKRNRHRRIEDADIDSIIDERNKYKFYDEGDKSKIQDHIRSVNHRLNKSYINRSDAEIDDVVKTEEKVDYIISTIQTNSPSRVIISIQIKPKGGGEIENTELLEEIGGINIYEKSARINLKEWEDHQRATNVDEGLANNLKTLLLSLLEEGYVFPEIKRKVTEKDLSDIPGDVFHWPVQFPEVLPQEANDCPKFDVIVGNPPYGDVMDDIEKALIQGMETASTNDIAAPFLERSLDLLHGEGIMGNIITLRFLYQKNATSVREVFKKRMRNVKIACFARRPEQVFEGAQARSSITTGRKVLDRPGLDNEEYKESDILTSRFIRLKSETREQQLESIKYGETNGLTLGEKIGSGENYSLPKVGNSVIRSILLSLRDQSDIGVIGDWRKSEDQGHNVWRRRGCAYWMNPMLQNLYPKGETPTSMYLMCFEDDLKRRFVFIIMQSSLYYLYWMAYKNERNIDWFEIDSFPVLRDKTIENNKEDIIDLSETIWGDMKERFVGKAREVFADSGTIKPIVDQVDDLVGPLYGLSSGEIDYVKKFDEEHRSLSDN